MNEKEKLNILIAEDEKTIGDLLVELLAHEDREITVVHDGLEAIKQLKQHSYDLLITDLMMPKVDGIEVMHRARKIYPEILIIIITGYASLETAIQAVKEGAYDYIRKPFRLDELKISVDNACEKIYLQRENKILLTQLKMSAEKKALTASLPEKNSQEPSPKTSIYGFDWLPPTYFKADQLSPQKALSELDRLGNLKLQGLIDEEEFKILKRKLLGKL